MVAPQEEEIARILDFVGHEQADGLETELAPVDVVPQKEIVGLGWVLAVIEKPQQVGVLAVDVACVWRGLPHTLRGASSSRKMGWLMKISLHLWQSPLISPSRRLTCFGTF